MEIDIQNKSTEDDHEMEKNGNEENPEDNEVRIEEQGNQEEEVDIESQIYKFKNGNIATRKDLENMENNLKTQLRAEV